MQLKGYGLQEYIGWGGEWSAAGPDQATGYNEMLADVIAEGATAGAAKASPGDAPMKDVPLRMALLGAPFAGKTSMALKLADEYGCKVCTAHTQKSNVHLLQECQLVDEM